MINAIRPDLIAGKIESADFQKHAAAVPAVPIARLKEMLWFVQAMSMEEGGLDRMVNTLIDEHPERFITPAMHAAGIPKNGRYTLAQCLPIWQAEWQSENFLKIISKDEQDDAWARAALLYHYEESAHRRVKSEPQYFSAWLNVCLDSRVTLDAIGEGVRYDQATILKGLEKYNFSFFHAECLAAARERLAPLLRDWCVGKSTPFADPKVYCPDLLGLVLEYMDQFKAERLARIAQTEVTRIVFRELEFAISQNVPVPIIGESRIGKTSPAKTWCCARPGRARLVTVPESNRFRDFIQAHADAFGIEYTPGTSTATLAEKVSYIYKWSGLFVCYDEAHFLIPVNYHKTTPPARLEFVRCQIIDPDKGCAFFATPQSYRQTLDQYVKTTGYRIEQWLGRISRPVILPLDLCAEDLTAVARILFPGVDDPYLKLICARAMRTDGYMKSMEMTAKRALFIAQENNHTRPTKQDVLDAIAQMMPDDPAPTPMAAPVRTVQTLPIQRTRKAPDISRGIPAHGSKPIIEAVENWEANAPLMTA